MRMGLCPGEVSCDFGAGKGAAWRLLLSGLRGLAFFLQGEEVGTRGPASCPDHPAGVTRPPPQPGALRGAGAAVERVSNSTPTQGTFNPEVNTCTHNARSPQSLPGQKAGPGPTTHPKWTSDVASVFHKHSGVDGCPQAPPAPDHHPVSAALCMGPAAGTLSASPGGSSWQARPTSWRGFHCLINSILKTPKPCVWEELCYPHFAGGTCTGQGWQDSNPGPGPQTPGEGGALAPAPPAVCPGARASFSLGLGLLWKTATVGPLDSGTKDELAKCPLSQSAPRTRPHLPRGPALLPPTRGASRGLLLPYPRAGWLSRCSIAVPPSSP